MLSGHVSRTTVSPFPPTPAPLILSLLAVARKSGQELRYLLLGGWKEKGERGEGERILRFKRSSDKSLQRGPCCSVKRIKSTTWGFEDSKEAEKYIF